MIGLWTLAGGIIGIILAFSRAFLGKVLQAIQEDEGTESF
jgi:hypothetical protein